MSKSPTSRIWFQMLRARPARALDPADLGTAYGLDMSFDAAVDPAPAAPRAVPGWWSRVMPWRRSVA
jgi:hypothetical protein